MPEQPSGLRYKEFLTTTEAARLLSVSSDTVLRWVRAGKVKSHRTLGGHFRIPVSELDIPVPVTESLSKRLSTSVIPPVHKYCWEFLARGGDLEPKCLECVTYRARAGRCYELKEKFADSNRLGLACNTVCEECEYFKLVRKQSVNVLTFSEDECLMEDVEEPDWSIGIRVLHVTCEYEAAAAVQEFRPDYIVIDCALGKKRTSALCGHFLHDQRIPVPRIILTSKKRGIGDYCEREAFGWLKKPFTARQLKSCIEGVPRT